MVNRKGTPKVFLTREEKDRVVYAIRQAESKTSGEIRVAFAPQAKGDVLTQAQQAFKKLGMAKTKDRNGVLIFLALKDHLFAILGDKGIHEKLGEEFWKEAAARMRDFFVKDEFGAGLEAAILEIGERLARHFPREKEDVNELPDKIREN